MSKVRLLTRREVDVAKARDRQREVEEGMKLAKRVDELRKLHAEEEKKYQEWRDSTVRHITEEIKSLLNIRDKLKEEVELLEQKK